MTLARLVLACAMAVSAPVLGAIVATPQALAGEEEMCRIKDSRLDEISGLAYSTRHDGVIWTHNDSGGGARVYALDDETCEVLAVLRIKGVPARDMEAIAAGANSRGERVLWLADIGDNLSERTTISLYEVREPEQLRNETVGARRFELTYPSGAQDAEALMALPDSPRVWIITKGILGGSVWKPRDALIKRFVTPLRKIGEEQGFVTDASMAPDASRYVVRDYAEARIYAGTPVGRLLTSLPLPDQVQGEAITWTPDGTSLVVASESDDRLIRVDVPEEGLPKSAGGSDGEEPAEPAADTQEDPTPQPVIPKAVEPVSQLGNAAVVALFLGGATFVLATVVVIIVVIVRDRRA